MAFKQPKKLDPEELYRYAVGLLGRRDYSKAEMRTKLLGRAVQPEDATRAMERLEEFAFLDDRRFATSYAQVRKESGGFGKGRVLRDLAVKRVPGELAKEIAEQTYAGSDEAQLVASYLERKFRGKQLDVFLSEPKNLQSAYRRLRNAGFSSSVTIKVLKRYASGAEALEQMEDEPPIEGPAD